MDEFNDFDNEMKDMYEIDIIREIKKLEEANKNLEERNSNEKKQYENSIEGELMQELDETRDFENRQKLKEKIKEIRKPKLDSLYEKLNEKIKQKENIVTQMKKVISADKGKITKLKKECNELQEKKENPDWEKEYNAKMNKIEELSKGIEKLSQELEKVKVRLEDLKNKNYEKILEEESKKQEKAENTSKSKNEEQTKKTNNNDIKWHSKLTQEQIEELQAEGIEPGNPEYYTALANFGIRDEEIGVVQDEKTNTNVPAEHEPEEQARDNDSSIEQKETTQADIEEVSEIEDNEGFDLEDDAKPDMISNQPGRKLIDEIKIFNDRTEIYIGDDKTIVSLEECNISEETLRRIKDFTGNVDYSVIRGLMSNEKQLNDYLDLCELYMYKNTSTPEVEGAIEQYKTMQELPKITYDFKGIRKSEVDVNEKLYMYNQAKETKKMFKEMGLKDNINIKIGLMDKIYLGLKSFTEGLKSKIALSAPKENKLIEEVEEQTQEKIVNYEEIEIPKEFFTDEVDYGEVTEEERKMVSEMLRNHSFREELGGYNINHEQAKRNAEQGNENPIQDQERENQ